MTATDAVRELPTAEVLNNLQIWLRHLETHPETDVDCSLEVKLPLSYLTRLMMQGEIEAKAPAMVVRELLEKHGYGSEQV